MNRNKLITILVVAAAVLLVAIIAILLLTAPAATPVEPVVPMETMLPELTDLPEEGGTQTEQTQAQTQAPTGEPAVEATVPVVDEAAQAAAPGPDASAETVMEYFFAQWNAGNAAAMDACRVAGDHGLYASDDLQYYKSVSAVLLRELSSEEARAGFDESWAPGAADVTLFEADVSIQYNDLGREEMVADGTLLQGMRFYLVKETADSPWRIAMQGF